MRRAHLSPELVLSMDAAALRALHGVTMEDEAADVLAELARVARELRAALG